MKQTNNAIKFLMAQYRAIFKHANIAMVAAMAATAFASTASAAATNPIGTWDGIKNTAAGNPELVIEGTDKSIVIPTTQKGGSFDDVLTVKITGGADNAIEGVGAGTGDQPASVYNGKNLTINLAATGDSGSAVLGIGSTTGNIEVNVKAVNVSKGTLNIGAQGAGKPSTLKAENIVIGVAGEKKNDLNQVNIKEKGTLAATTKLTVEAGSNVNVEGKLLGSTIDINGGTVTLSGGATAADTKLGTLATPSDATNTTLININGGKVTAAATKSGSILADKIVISGGEVDAAGTLVIGAKDKSLVVSKGSIKTSDGAAALTIASNTEFKGGSLNVAQGTATLNGTNEFGKDSFVNSGTVVLNGNTTFANDALGTNAIGANGVLKIGKAKVTMNADTFKALTKGNNNKIHVSGDANPVAEINLTDDTVNLETTKGIGILADAGTLGGKLDSTNGKFKFSGKAATFAQKDINNTAEFAFNSFTGGTTAAGFNVSGGAAISVTEALNVTDNKALNVKQGTINLAGDAAAVSKKVGAKSITLGEASNVGNLNVKSGKWTVPSVTFTNGSGSVTGAELSVSGDLAVTKGTLSLTEGATLKVTGNLTTAGKDGKITANKSVIDTVGGGTVTLGAATAAGLELKNTSEIKLEAADFQKNSVFDASALKDAIVGESNTTISFVDAEGQKLTLSKADFDKLEQSVGDGFKGLFNVNVTGITNAQDGMALGDVTNNAAIEAYEQVSVKQASATAVTDTNRSVGSVEVTGGNTLNMGTDTSLTLNKAKDGKLVYEVKNGVAQTGNVVFKDAGNSLTLAGTGEIGSITVESSADAGTVTIGKANKTGAVTVKGNIGAEAKNSRVVGVTVNNNSSLNANNVYTTDLVLGQGSSLIAATDGVVDVAGTATIMGNVEAGTLKFAKGASIAGNASVDVSTLDLAGSQTLTIGKDGDAEGKGSSSAAVFADTFIMGAGSTLFVDPAYTEKASILAVQTIQGDVAGTDVGIAQGNIIVGKNAAFGYGFDQAGFESVMADYLVDGKFIDPKKNIGGVANAFVLNKPLTIKSGNYVAVDANLTAAPATPTLNSLTLGKNSALIVTESAFEGGKAALTFGKIATTGGETVSDAKVIASENAKISLVGTFTVKSKGIKIFDAAKSTSGGGQVAVSGSDITVEALGGLLSGTLAVGANSGTLGELKLSDDAETLAYDGVARPVGDMLLGIAKAEFDTVDNGVGYKFVTTTMGLPGGYKAIDAAAHAATYAGAQQAAVASVTTMADAMFGRVGAVGVEAASISATGSQTKGGVWLTPMYKSVDADGFNAEGASYGADVDLAGVAFGTDTVNGNMRFGAVFNIGSGDADGKGNGNGLKDEFDYYGLGIYSAMGFDNFALVGDASLTVISHDVKGFDLHGKADTKAVTMGLTGQYTFATPAVDVTPHLGARFVRLDTESYDLNSAKGTIATTDFDVQNVFSVPVGVTLSKAFVAGGWSLAPNADLTVTFNSGDTEAKSTTTFTGARAIDLNSEVLDEVTYGVTLGLGAQYGAFGTSFGINYTGSENTDAFGVNAQCRYMF